MAADMKNLQVFKAPHVSAKSAYSHLERTKNDEIRRTSGNGRSREDLDVSQLPNASINHNSLATRNSIELFPLSSKGLKKVKLAYKTYRLQESAGAKLPSATSGTQNITQKEVERGLKTPIQRTSKYQAKASKNSRMLVTVNVCGSTGPLRFLVNTEDTVNRIKELALRSYAREGRLPHIGVDCDAVELYCVNNNFEALDRMQSVGSVGARQFLLYRRNGNIKSTAKKTENRGIMPWKFVWNLMKS